MLLRSAAARHEPHTLEHFECLQMAGRLSSSITDAPPERRVGLAGRQMRHVGNRTWSYLTYTLSPVKEPAECFLGQAAAKREGRASTKRAFRIADHLTR